MHTILVPRDDTPHEVYDRSLVSPVFAPPSYRIDFELLPEEVQEISNMTRERLMRWLRWKKNDVYTSSLSIING